MSLQHPQFLRTHLFFPLLVAGLAWALVIGFSLDRHLADFFYHLGGNTWAWKSSWLTEHLVHRGGRNLSFFLLFIVALLHSHKKQLWYLFLASGGSSLIVVLLKELLAVSCPWEFNVYGGRLPYQDIAQQLFSRNGSGCFPAGHASAGYAWIGLYFFMLQSRWRWLTLASALSAGILFGFVQQLRGAHFISHDLATVTICWFYSLGLYLAFFSEKRAPVKANLRDE
jgi:membrane-associated PAP2 superfamily phosphatase